MTINKLEHITAAEANNALHPRLRARRGDFASLFKAIAKAQKKGEFAAALCVGNFLGEIRERRRRARRCRSTS